MLPRCQREKDGLEVGREEVGAEERWECFLASCLWRLSTAFFSVL